ncbi:hypothetical protein [Streptomyces sp. CB01881]|uniref:hypothetical protein n=1 Tax=Streptomyces sp. CB01881 TaxID=2078691 RepID=UPI000CDC3940|nr:hypothetical protein [Streptomyces sp. CB01881]AUY51925.1 hypothetical protein C2142_26780 [Streptomyces sp. CB01881]TYC71354.1 hypothetical protein EH183_26760 [Streptomyces sp. CB01881]
MNRSEVLLVLMTRLRVALAVAGLAWLLGVQPGLGGRVLLAVLVVTVLAVDTASTESERRLFLRGAGRRRAEGAR